MRKNLLALSIASLFSVSAFAADAVKTETAVAPSTMPAAKTDATAPTKVDSGKSDVKSTSKPHRKVKPAKVEQKVK